MARALGKFVYFAVKNGEYYFKRGPDRDSFECSTAYKSLNYGCSLISDAILKSVILSSNERGKDKSGITKVIIVHASDELQIKPKIIIDATGVNSPFHGFLRIPKRDYKKGVIFGVTGNDFVSPDASEVYFDADLILLKEGIFMR